MSGGELGIAIASDEHQHSGHYLNEHQHLVPGAP